jgi:hypothetical protein
MSQADDAPGSPEVDAKVHIMDETGADVTCFDANETRLLEGGKREAAQP